MDPLIVLPLQALAIVCLIMAVAWIWATKLENYSIVDSFWSFNFAIVAVFIFVMAGGNGLRKTMVLIPVLLWSFRLGTHLTVRIFSHLSEEEGRYKQLRQEWAKNLRLKFFFFFQAQAISNIWLAIPFFIISVNKDPVITWNEWLGLTIWCIAVAGEAIADWQLVKFKKENPGTKKVCEYGLWYYSRHPNYFFQLTIWVGVLIFALSSPYGWIAIISPLSVAYLLFRVTGIPMNEEQSLRSKGDAYMKYQKNTSPFVPWFKLNNK
jgi:steroid 5-alpha reductase family enzyme